MKKEYDAPQLFFKEFRLSQAIAYLIDVRPETDNEFEEVFTDLSAV